MPFNIGPGELILILIIALVVLGPGKLPDVASSLGKSLREFRKAASDVSDATRIDPPAPRSDASAAPASASNPAPLTPAEPPKPTAPPTSNGDTSSEATGSSESADAAAPAAVGGESTTDSRA